MKHALYIATLVFGLLSCNSQTTKETANTKNTRIIKPIQVTPTARPKEKIYIKDKSLYDPAFLASLSVLNEPIQVIDNYILAGRDTIYFPEEIPMNKETVFKGMKEQKNFILTVTRVNLTSLTYNFVLLNKDNTLIHNKTGKVILGLFFLGSESDEDDETGDYYFSTEYRDELSDCSFSIRVGEREGHEKLRANINLHCKDNKSDNIENSPTLRTND